MSFRGFDCRVCSKVVWSYRSMETRLPQSVEQMLLASQKFCFKVNKVTSYRVWSLIINTFWEIYDRWKDYNQWDMRIFLGGSHSDILIVDKHSSSYAGYFCPSTTNGLEKICESNNNNWSYNFVRSYLVESRLNNFTLLALESPPNASGRNSL